MSAAVSLGSLAGCAEQPSYLLSWTLVDAEALDEAPDDASLSSVKDCSEVGVSKVRVTTKLGGAVVDVSEYACFPGDAVEGPALEPGEYTLEVEGLRRSGEPWEPNEDMPATPRVAHDTATVSVSQGALPSVEFVLVAPPECDDGIDNDLDGKVDGKDPGCLLNAATGASATGSEDAESGVALVRPSVSFLANEAVKPFNVGVGYILLEVEVEAEAESGTQTQWVEFAEVADWQLDLSSSPFGLPLLSFDPAFYDALNTNFAGRTTALGPDLEPVTEAIDFEFTVDGDQIGFVTEVFEFTSDLFIDPIIEPLRLSLGLQLGAGDTSICELNGYTDLDDDGKLDDPIALERVWVRVRDADDQALDAATLGLAANAHAGGMIAPVDEAGGWVSFECPASNVSSAPLEWGSYRIEVEGRIGDETCFTLPETDEGLAQGLAPQPVDAQELYLDRVVEDGGPPPAACAECNELDAGAPGARQCDGATVCEDGICVTKAPTGG
ncbi:hypothetical protein ENSA5_21470 [Enhygromyxa salina]|uniref:Uncharacterized protein n=1 Tax=Enhygromyxa salina TaxID=215803 RepID=A0A2S9YCF7_9BACT|nr:hypothetical protein [Enhygromyxa salina]PRQ02794.1 hypothetical protein ENSA5_21470 [Enhygromyxa salina]